MADQTLQQELKPDEYTVMQQGINQDEQRALQEGTPDTRAVQQGMKPRYPDWPTSKPGPRAMQPPPGMRPWNSIRAEQMAEIGYNQVLGEPSTQSATRSMPDPDPAKRQPVSPDQLVSADVPQSPKRGKERL